MELASATVVASRFAERSLLGAGIAAHKVAVIPYGVNTDWFAGKTRRSECATALFALKANKFSAAGLA